LENGLERLQALALVGVPQEDPLVTPAARENLTVGRKGHRPDLTAAIFSNVREHICNGRLRLCPRESTPLPVKVRSRGRLATFRKMQSPVALELLELLATVNIPQPDRLVVRPTDKQGGIRRIETDAIYSTAAIFSNVSFTGTTLRLSPPESTPLPR